MNSAASKPRRLKETSGGEFRVFRACIRLLQGI